MHQSSKLLNRNFFLLWQGQFVSRIGSEVFSIAAIIWIKQATESATLMGILGMVAAIPALLLGPIGGAFADRYSRRRIIIFSDVINGLAVMLLAVVFYLQPENSDAILASLFGVAISIAIVSSFFVPAISASIPDLVPSDGVAGANSLRQLSSQLSMFLGQGLGGVLFRVLGAPLVVLIDGITYLFSALSETFITIPQSIPEDSSDWRQKLALYKRDLREGFRYVWKAPGLKQLVFVSAFLNLFVMPIILLLPFYVEDVLNVTLDWYGYLLATFGVGSLVGSFIAGFAGVKAKARGVIMIVFMVFESLLSGLLGLTGNPVVALAITFSAGLMGGFIGINVVTILQTRTPSELRGRVFGFLNTLTGSIAPVGMGLGGVIADISGRNIPLIYVICGGAMALLSILVSFSRDFREFVSYEGEVKVAPVINPVLRVRPSEV